MPLGSGTLGMGVVFTLRDQFSRSADRIMAKTKQLDAITEASAARITASINKMRLGFMGLAVGALFLLPFAQGIKLSKEFSFAMSDVKAKTNATTEQMALLNNEALRLGELTKFTATEAAEGMAFLGMAGFRTDEILKAMGSTLDLAAAGELGLAKAADIASNVMSQFNLDASEMARISDVIANTATTANTNVEQMANALKFLGPTAAALNIPLEEVSSTIGLLGNAGLQGSFATRALGSSIARLSKPTAEMNRKMEELGISFFDARGEFVGLNKMIGQLEGALKGLSPEQKQNAIVTIFQAESIQEINALLSAEYSTIEDGIETVHRGAKAMEEYTKVQDNAAGAAKRMAETKLDNLTGDLIKLRSIIQTTFIKAGNPFEPFLRPLIKGLTETVRLIGMFVDTRFGKVIMGIVAAIGTLLFVLGAYILIQGVASFMAAKAAVAFASMGKGAVAAAFATKGLRAGLIKLIPALWAAVIPLLPFIAAAVALGAVVVFLVKSWRSFDKVMQGAEVSTNKFTRRMQQLGGILQAGVQIWRSFKDGRFALSEDMVASLEKLGIKDFVLNLGTWIVRAKTFIKGFMQPIRLAFGQVKEVLGELWNTIKGPIISVLESLGFEIGKNESSLDKWMKAGQMVGGIISAVFFVIKGVIMVVTDVVKVLINAFKWLWFAIKSGFNSVVNIFLWIDDKISRIIEAIKNFFAAVRDVDQFIGNNVFGVIGDFFTGGGDANVTTAPVANNIGDNIVRNSRPVVNFNPSINVPQSEQGQQVINVSVDMDGQQISRNVIQNIRRQDSLDNE